MKLPRRRWLLLAVAGVAVVLLRPEPPPRPRLATFKKVRVGMTWDEAVATVGGPPGNYESPGWPVTVTTKVPPDEGHHWWQADDGILFVRIEDDRVVEASTMGPARPSLLDRLRRRLGF